MIVNLESNEDNRNGKTIEEKEGTKIGNKLNGQGFGLESKDLNLDGIPSTH